MGCGAEVSRGQDQLTEQRARYGAIVWAFQNFLGPASIEQEEDISQDAQKVRPARPQPMKAPEA
jgi:hypothetical protein